MEEEKKYPKVLIIGEPMNERSGSGITITNLFKEWPCEKIALAAPHIDIEYCEKERPCAMYFIYNGKGAIVEHKDIGTQYDCRRIKRRKNFLYKLAKSCVLRSGIIDFFSWHEISDDFLLFFDSFQPEVVYTALGSIRSMNYFIELKKKRNFKLAIHIWDDWLVGSFNYRFLPSFWKRKAAKTFNTLLKSTEFCFSGSQLMANEYYNRYNKTFIPLHNSIKLSEWDGLIYPDNNERKRLIIYIGKINRDTIDNLIDMSTAVDSLSNESYISSFHIYTPDYNNENVKIFSKYSRTHIFSSLSHKDIPQTLISASLLFLPLGFSAKSIQYARLSMPTKVSEYLISRTPILLYCPSELTLYKYLQENNCAIICDKGVEKLSHILTSFSVDKYQDIIDNGYKLGVKNHSDDLVNELFRTTLLKSY